MRYKFEHLVKLSLFQLFFLVVLFIYFNKFGLDFDFEAETYMKIF